MATFLFLAAAQLVVFGAGFLLLWRKLGRMNGELMRLRQLVESRELDRAATKRTRAHAEPALARAGGGSARPEAPWPPPPADRRVNEPPLVVIDDIEEPSSWRAALTPQRLFTGATAALAALPLLGLPFGLALGELTVAGLMIAAALTLASLREGWSRAAWAGAIGGCAWALAGLSLGGAIAAPITFSAGAAFAGVAGLALFYMRGGAPGAILSLGMGAGLVGLGALAGIIGPAGGALVLLVLIAASLGASSLRREPLHHAAFAAAGVGLFVLSAQGSAAIWFTPAAALAGALFLAIAFLRVPQLGPRGGALAGTGAGASMFAVGALYVSQHGLANPLAAAGAFLALALAFAGLIALAAHRRQGGVDTLKLTLWVLAFCAFAATASAIFIATPAPLAAPLMAGVAAGLVLLDARVKSVTWRALATGALVLACLAAWSAGNSFAMEAPIWPRWALVLAAFAAPAALAAAATPVARRAGAPITADLFETFAILAALAAATLTLRYIFSAAEPDMVPIGFIEAGAIIALWLSAVLLLASNEHKGLAGILFVISLTFGAIAGVLWLTPFWLEQPLSGLNLALFQHAPLGFALMAAPLWSLWLYWRMRGAQMRTRTAFGAAALATAAFLTHEYVIARGPVSGADWPSIGAGVSLFVLAIAASTAPQVVGAHRPRYLRRRA